MTGFDLQGYMSQRRAQVDAELSRLLPERPGKNTAKLHEAMRYAVLQGGKRMRPVLTMAACEAAGGTAEQALPAACAVELIHAYSLVHDDLPAMDNDVERRGKPTVHVAFGEDIAILAGDALLTEAFRVLALGRQHAPEGRLLEAVEVLARHAGADGMAGGQVMDLVAGQDIKELELLEAVHALKTGGLYAASGAMGALCAGADDKRVAQLEEYGLKFGIAFQHADDILDDDQPSLREQSVARVDQLVGQCLGLVEALGPQAEALRAVARWVHERTHAAKRGETRD